jgi:hypothetical protein
MLSNVQVYVIYSHVLCVSRPFSFTNPALRCSQMPSPCPISPNQRSNLPLFNTVDFLLGYGSHRSDVLTNPTLAASLLQRTHKGLRPHDDIDRDKLIQTLQDSDQSLLTLSSNASRTYPPSHRI